MKGFDKKHPNSLEQDSGWNNYDWDKLRVNARAHALQALTPTPGEGTPPTGM